MQYMTNIKQQEELAVVIAHSWTMKWEVFNDFLQIIVGWQLGQPTIFLCNFAIKDGELTPSRQQKKLFFVLRSIFRNFAN